MHIGNVALTNKVLLAPMAGITNLSFRLLARDFGCALAYTEMISAAGLVKASAKSLEYLHTSPKDRPLGVQLFGNNPAVLAEGARIVARAGADVVDINMGCPAKKVVRTGAGAALLRNPSKIADIIQSVRMAIRLPLTVKIRSGWRRQEVTAVEVAHIAEDCGADAVIVHARTADQGFGGKADWDIIGAVKEHVTIPVVGNGDIRNAGDALRMLETTGCDAIMVGRGALGNPWLVSEITARLSCQARPPFPSLREREQIIREHLAMEIDQYGEIRGSRNFRKHLLWYTKGLPGGALFRHRAGALTGKEEILNALHLFFAHLEEQPLPDEKRERILMGTRG